MIINGDVRDILHYWKEKKMPYVDYVITSPPYWNMLRKSRGNSKSTHTKRKEDGLDLYYSNNPKDVGNIVDYNMFLDTLRRLFGDIKNVMNSNAYLTIIVQNIRIEDGSMQPLAFDLVKILSNQFTFVSDKLWLQDDIFLGIWGYPYGYVPNVCHHYCLTFKKKSINKKCKKQINKNRYIDLGNRGLYDKNNSLNNLTGKEWLKFTKSWKIYRPKPRNKVKKDIHPATFPMELVEDFISFFTKENQIVLDPFIGTGTTALTCKKLNRKCIGIELNEEYVNYANELLKTKGREYEIENKQKEIF